MGLEKASWKESIRYVSFQLKEDTLWDQGRYPLEVCPAKATTQDAPGLGKSWEDIEQGSLGCPQGQLKHSRALRYEIAQTVVTERA